MIITMILIRFLTLYSKILQMIKSCVQFFNNGFENLFLKNRWIK